jgi:hypothetical protein
MRLSLVVAALLALGACTPAPPMSAQNNRADLNKFVQPTNGAAYSQGDLYYYTTAANPGYMGPAGIPPRHP